MQTRRTLIWLCEGMCPCGGRRPSQRGVAGPHRQNDESASKPVTIVRGVCGQIWTVHSEFVISRRDGRQTREMSNGVVPFMRFHIIPSPMIRKLAVLGVIAFALSAPTANAQRERGTGGPVELGIDGGVAFGLDNPNTTIVSLPVQDFRLGYFIDNKVELEPRLSLNSIHGGG